MSQFHLGSISHATMRAEDLIPAFCDTLRELCLKDKSTEYDKLLEECAELMDKAAIDPEVWNSEDACLILNEDLFEALNSFCPWGVYFGSHPGDGADYGFWVYDQLTESAEEEGIKIVSDLSEINLDDPNDNHSQVLLINDHGNCTYYEIANGDGPALEEVWSCV